VTSPLLTASRQITCAILVLWMGLITLGPMLHDGLGHDKDWTPVLVQHDASHHRIDNPAFPPLGHEDHCVVCHLFCASRHPATPSTAVHAAVRLSYVVPIDDAAELVASAIVPLPARAPPAHS
jgi:hypothetical protein